MYRDSFHKKAFVSVITIILIFGISRPLVNSQNETISNKSSMESFISVSTEEQHLCHYILTITIDGNGYVVKDPDCSQYMPGTVVELTAVPDTSWSLSHWSGDLSGSNNPEYIIMDGDKNVTAHFMEDQYTLTINTAGNGYVVKDPDCSQYMPGTVVELTAVPDTSWSFSHWSGDLNGSENPTNITIDGNKTVTAHFVLEEYTLTVKAIGNGYVIIDPDLEFFPAGTIVNLNAVADTGWSFNHWSGDLNGSENPTSIIMDQNKTINAHFEEEIDDVPPTVKIIRPKNAIYIFDKRLMRFILPLIIIGSLTIDAEAFDNETGVERVEFFVDNKLKNSDTSSPYNWTWKNRIPRKHIIRVTAYDHAGNSASDEIMVWKWKFHPLLIMLLLTAMINYQINDEN